MTTSYWQHTLGSSPPLHVDVAVVGAGVMGAGAAYWLKHRDPDLSVALLDASGLAQGASGRNAGFILSGVTADYANDIAVLGEVRARRLLAFTRENRRLLTDALDASAFDFRPTGSWILAGTEREAHRLGAAAKQLALQGVPAELVGPQSLEPQVAAQGFHGGLFMPENGEVHPAKLVRHLAERSGAQLFPHHPVTALQNEGEGIRLETPVRSITADRVLLTLNAYLPHLCPELAHIVRPVRAQMFATAPGLPRLLTAPVYSHEGYYYLRQLADGRVLVGGARHRHVAAEVGYADAVTTPLQADLEAYLATHFPALSKGSIARRWSGTMGFSPDGLPVVGRVPGQEGVWFAAGFTGHGMGYGVRMGQLLADAVLEKRPADLDLFSAARFNLPV